MGRRIEALGCTIADMQDRIDGLQDDYSQVACANSKLHGMLYEIDDLLGINPGWHADTRQTDRMELLRAVLADRKVAMIEP